MVRKGLKRRVNINIGMLNQWVGEEDDVGNHEDADPLQAPVKESMWWEWRNGSCILWFRNLEICWLNYELQFIQDSWSCTLYEYDLIINWMIYDGTCTVVICINVFGYVWQTPWHTCYMSLHSPCLKTQHLVSWIAQENHDEETVPQRSS